MSAGVSQRSLFCTMGNSMQLDRNTSDAGKYAVIKMKQLQAASPRAKAAFKLLVSEGIALLGPKGSSEEFFVIMLKDINADSALRGYAAKASLTDMQLAREVKALSERAGKNSPFAKRPD